MEKGIWQNWVHRGRRNGNYGRIPQTAEEVGPSRDGERNSKKSNSHIRSESKLKLIEKQVKRYPIQVLSQTLGIGRSRIYRHLEGKVSNRKKESERLDQAIRQVYLESNKIYGAPKVYAELIRQGVKTSLKRVQRHMKALGIRSKFESGIGRVVVSNPSRYVPISIY